MNTNTYPKFFSLLTIGLAIALLASLGTTAAMPSEANAETWDSSMNPSFISTTQNDPDVELNEKLAQFEQYLAEMQRELAIPGMSVASCFLTHQSWVPMGTGFHGPLADPRSTRGTRAAPATVAPSCKISRRVRGIGIGHLLPAARIVCQAGHREQARSPPNQQAPGPQIPDPRSQIPDPRS